MCEDYAAIACPVLAVGGWVDGYTDAVPRLLEHLQVPRRGIIGPWGHVDAVDGAPGPNVGMLQELVRWFGHWLRGDENGAMDGPMLRAYVQEWNDPATRLDERPGRWVGVANWPESDDRRSALGLGDRRLGPIDPAPSMHVVRGLQATGLDSGAWCADGHSDDLPPDQRADDGRSLTLRQRAPDGAAGDPRVPRGGARARERPAPGPGRRAAVRGRAGRQVAAGGARVPQPDAPELPRRARAAGAGPALPRAGAVRRRRPPLPGRQPGAAGGLADLLAAGLAVARAGDAHPALRRHEPGRAADALPLGRGCP